MVENREHCDDGNEDSLDGCDAATGNFRFPDPAATADSRFCSPAFDNAAANRISADPRVWQTAGVGTDAAPHPPRLPAVPESQNTIYAIRTTEPQYAPGDYTYTLGWDNEGALPFWPTASATATDGLCVLDVRGSGTNGAAGGVTPDQITVCDPAVAGSCAGCDSSAAACTCVLKVESWNALSNDPTIDSAFGQERRCVSGGGRNSFDFTWSSNFGGALCPTGVCAGVGETCVSRQLRFSDANFAQQIQVCPFQTYAFCSTDPAKTCTADAQCGGGVCVGFCAGNAGEACSSATACSDASACQFPADLTITGDTVCNQATGCVAATMDGENFILPAAVVTQFRDVQVERLSRAYRYSHSVRRHGLVNSQPFRVCAAMSQAPATAAPQWFDTGFNVVVTEGCSVDADCQTGDAQTNLQASGVTSAIPGLSDFSNTVQHRTSCVIVDTTGGTTRGICVDPNDRVVQGNNLYNPIVERSCPNPVPGGSQAFVNLLPARDTRRNFALSLYGKVQDFEVVYGRGVFDLLSTDSPCPCSSDGECAAGELCCKRTKWNEPAGVPSNDRLRHIRRLMDNNRNDALELTKEWSLIAAGTCFNTEKQGCCDNGYIYNKVTEHCCQIGGVLNIDEPCPCASPEHCQNPDATVGGNNFMTCCMQQFPAVDATCNYFANWPVAPRTTRNLLVTTGADMDSNFVDQRARTALDEVKSGIITDKWTRTYRNFINRDLGTGSLFNYQSAQGAMRAIRDVCPGRCVDTRLEICCNGLPCNAHYERCCNSTCCNKFSESCKETSVAFGSPVPRRAGFLKTFWADVDRFNGVGLDNTQAVGAAGRAGLAAVDNAAGFDVKYEVCVGREETITITVFYWTVFLPFLFCVTTALSLWITAFWVLRSSEGSSDSWGRWIVLSAVLSTLFLIPLYFSPLFNYTLIGTAVAVFTILIGGSNRYRSHRLSTVAAFLNVIFFLYLLDPFNGNELLSFSSTPFGSIEQRTAGLFHDVSFCQQNSQYPGCQCVEFYGGYFAEPTYYSNRRDQYVAESYANPARHNLPQRVRERDFTKGDYAVHNDWTQNTPGVEPEEVAWSGIWSSYRRVNNWAGMQTWGFCDRNWIAFNTYSVCCAHFFVAISTLLLVLSLTVSVRKDQVRKFKEVGFDAHEEQANATNAQFVESWDQKQPVPEYN
jgi:hypothetical protein